MPVAKAAHFWFFWAGVSGAGVGDAGVGAGVTAGVGAGVGGVGAGVGLAVTIDDVKVFVEHLQPTGPFE